MRLGLPPSGTLRVYKDPQAQKMLILPLLTISALGKADGAPQTTELTLCPWVVHRLFFHSTNRTGAGSRAFFLPLCDLTM